MVQSSLKTEQEAVMQLMTNMVSAHRRSNLFGFFFRHSFPLRRDLAEPRAVEVPAPSRYLGELLCSA